MGLFENMPYTNYHDLNADWIIKECLKMLEDWQTYQTTINGQIEDLQSQIDELAGE